MQDIKSAPPSASHALWLLAHLAQALAGPLGIKPEKLFDELIIAGAEACRRGLPVEATVAAAERACGLPAGSIKAAGEKLQGRMQ
jgi:hypothetical protein